MFAEDEAPSRSRSWKSIDAIGDLDHRAAREIADGGRHALDGFSVTRGSSAEPGFDEHELI